MIVYAKMHNYANNIEIVKWYEKKEKKKKYKLLNLYIRFYYSHCSTKKKHILQNTTWLNVSNIILIPFDSCIKKLMCTKKKWRCIWFRVWRCFMVYSYLKICMIPLTFDSLLIHIHVTDSVKVILIEKIVQCFSHMNL